MHGMRMMRAIDYSLHGVTCVIMSEKEDVVHSLPLDACLRQRDWQSHPSCCLGGSQSLSRLYN